MFYSPNWLNEPLSHTHSNQRSPFLSPLSLSFYHANRISVARRLRLWKSFESSYSMYIEQYWISWVFFYWGKNNVALDTQTFFLSVPLHSLIELDVKEANVNFFVRKQNFRHWNNSHQYRLRQIKAWFKWQYVILIGSNTREFLTNSFLNFILSKLKEKIRFD